MAKNCPSIFPCIRGIYLIFLWNKAVRIIVMGTGPLGSFLLALHTLPQAPGAVWLPKATPRTTLPWGTSCPGTAGLLAQKARVLASLHLCLPPHPPAHDWQKNIKAHLFASGQDNSEVWLPLNSSTAGLESLPGLDLRLPLAWLLSCCVLPLTPLPVSPRNTSR